MTDKVKRRARARMARTGETYTQARRAVSAEHEAARWNARHPVGTEVVLQRWKGGPEERTKTRSEAFLQSSGHVSVFVEGHESSYGVEWVRAVEEAKT